jgi:hypothetical protein
VASCSPKSDRFKSKALAELAELADQQRMKKEGGGVRRPGSNPSIRLFETTAKAPVQGSPRKDQPKSQLSERLNCWKCGINEAPNKN